MNIYKTTKLILCCLLAFMSSAQIYADDTDASELYYVDRLGLVNGEWVPIEFKVAPCPNGKYSGDIVIPEYHNGRKVSSIAERAFENCTEVTSVKMPNTITQIQEFAFSGCSGLTNIDIPETVFDIGQRAFMGCTGLETITLPGAVGDTGGFLGSGVVKDCTNLKSFRFHLKANAFIKIPEYTFSNCANLEEIDITGKITTIERYAFENCTSLTSITLPADLRSINNNAFRGCTNLKSVDFPEGLQEIQGFAFWGCSSLSLISIPSSVTSIQREAFCNCTNLESADISKTNLTSIDDWVFRTCSKLKSITIPETVTKIGDRSFADCVNLSSVTFLGNLITKISGYAFAACSNLTTIDLPTSLEEIGEKAFVDCKSLQSITIPNSVTKVGTTTFWGCKELSEVNLPEGLTRIENGMFAWCSKLSNITIPKTVESIGDDAFGNSGLEFIDIPNAVRTIGDNAFKSTPLSSVKFGNSVEYIGNGTFSETKLTSVVIPNTVTSIGTGTFSGNPNLKSVIIGSSIPGIPQGMFNYDFYLESVVIPESVKSIHQDAFRHCPVKTIVNFAKTPQPITAKVFQDQPIIYVPKESVEAYKAADYWKEYTIYEYVPENVELIDGEDFGAALATEVKSITYTRTFNNTGWQALYVPFSMSYNDWHSQGLEVARLSGYHEYDDDNNGIVDGAALEILMVEEGQGRLKPNHPYMVRANSIGEKTIVIENTTLYPAESNSINCATIETEYSFTGTQTILTAAEIPSAYVMSGGSLRPNAGDLKANRWYMTRESRDSQLLPELAEIKVFVHGEDEADGINFIRIDSDATEDGTTYNLMGQKVKANTKGIIIKNGKKYINK